METLMSLKPKKREYTRVRALPEDDRVAVIRRAFAKCETRLRCRLREHIRDGEYQDIERFVGVLNELHLHGPTAEGLLGIGHAVNQAIEITLFEGNGAPKESACESFATESVVEGQTNAAVARALEPGQKSPGQIHSAISEINRHISALIRQRLVLQREARAAESRTTAR